MKKMRKVTRHTLLFLAVLILAAGAAKYLSGIVKISSNVNGRELPIYSVEREEKQVALSFDAAWGNDDTEAILSILSKHNIRSTFFMTGGWVEKYPEDVKAIQAAGHDLGNHSENHKNMSQLSKAQCKDEIMKVHKKVKELTGTDMNLFRPPYGDYEDKVILAAQDSGYYPIQWSVDAGDTSEKQMLQGEIKIYKA